MGLGESCQKLEMVGNKIIADYGDRIDALYLDRPNLNVPIQLLFYIPKQDFLALWFTPKSMLSQVILSSFVFLITL